MKLMLRMPMNMSKKKLEKQIGKMVMMKERKKLSKNCRKLKPKQKKCKKLNKKKRNSKKKSIKEKNYFNKLSPLKFVGLTNR